MADLYANENFPFPAVEELRRLGHDVLTMADANQAGEGLGDEEVLEFARSQKRVLLSLNRKHFIRLHQTKPNHAGIIVCTFDPDFKALASRIDEAIKAHAPLEGKLIRINRPARHGKK